MIRTALLALAALAAVACDARAVIDTLAGQAFAAGRAPIVEAAPADTVPTVTRRVWSGPEADWIVDPSPDGRSVAITDWVTGDLAIVNLATKDTLRLTRNETPYVPGFGMFPRFSPDGSRVVFGWWNMDTPSAWELRISPSEGGEVRVLYPGTTTPWIQPEDWSPDGRWILAWRAQEDFTNQIVLVDSESGETRVLKTLDWRAPIRMNFSPDGRWIVYDFPPDEDSSERDVYALAVDGSRELKLVENPANDFVLGWAPDGSVLFASDRTGTPSAWLLPLAAGRPAGDPLLVKPDMFQAVPVSFMEDGSYMYGIQTGTRDVYVASLDPQTGRVAGPPVKVAARGLGMSQRAAWSPDGRHLAYFVQRGPNMVSNRNRIAIRSLETGQAREIAVSTRLTYLRRLQWLPDGGALLLDARDDKGSDGAFRLNIQTGRAEPMFQKSGVNLQYIQLAPDGRTLVVSEKERSAGPQREERLVAHDLETGDERVLFRMTGSTSEQIRRVVVSPDGSQLAFVLWRQDEDDDIMLLPMAGGEPSVVATGRFFQPEWAPDGRHLYLARPLDPEPHRREIELVRVPIEGGEPESMGITMERLGDLRVHGPSNRIAFTAGQQQAELWVMANFLPEARATAAASGQ